MPVLGIDRLLRRRPMAAMLAALTGGSYELQSDTLRLGRVTTANPVHEVEVEGQTIATVVGPDAERVAGVLSAVAEIETERRRLADEVLALYREVNLMYALADRLAGATDSSDLAQRMTTEATRLVPATASMVIIEGASPRATRFGDHAAIHEPAALARARVEVAAQRSTLIAPLTVDERERGAIVLFRDGQAFSAGDLKLVSTVASQGAALVARVLDGERRQAAAEHREQRLRQQIDELRVELDASRQATDDEVPESDAGYLPELRARIEALRKIVRSSVHDDAE